MKAKQQKQVLLHLLSLHLFTNSSGLKTRVSITLSELTHANYVYV